MSHSAIKRPQRHQPTARVAARPVAVARTIGRTNPVRIINRPDRIDPSSFLTDFQPDPYTDYGRWLTPEGGVLFKFKDIDLRFRHTVWRLLAWSISTSYEGWFLIQLAPLHTRWLDIACLVIVAIANWLIVARPVETYRGIEIRPDCMIIDGAEVFWARFMETGNLTFQPDQDGNQVLCGVYGTRFVKYLTVRRFDPCDRTPEVFAAHLCEAMKQLWEQPS